VHSNKAKPVIEATSTVDLNERNNRNDGIERFNRIARSNRSGNRCSRRGRM